LDYPLWHAIRLLQEGSSGFFGGISSDGINTQRYSKKTQIEIIVIYIHDYWRK
tara:strand:- start:507 stop:665 length:159 start_codon:yes stop_codon:yes gene_type:complete